MISAPAAYTTAALTNPARILAAEITRGANVLRYKTHTIKNSTDFASAPKRLRVLRIRRSSDPRESRFALSELRCEVQDFNGEATAEIGGAADWIDGAKFTLYETFRGLDWDAGEKITLFTGIVKSVDEGDSVYSITARGVFADALAADLWGGAVATLAADMTASQKSAIVTKGQGLEPSGSVLIGTEPTTYASLQDNGNGTHTLKGLVRSSPDPSNLFPFPEELNDSIFTRFGAAVAEDAEQDPDGNLTAETLIEDSSTGLHVLSYHPNNSVIPMPANTDFTISFFARPNGRDELKLLAVRRPDPAANATAWFNLNTGVVGTETNGDGAIAADDNGYFRCALSFNSGEGSLWSTVGFTFFLGVATEDEDYAGNGTAGVDIWGVKVERGSLSDYVAKASITSEAHTAGEDVRQYFPLGSELAPLHIIDAIRQLLIGPAGPGGVGLSSDWIDDSGFSAAKTAIGDFPVVWINGRNRTNAKRAIEGQGFRVAAAYPAENNLGQVRPVLLDIPAAGDFVATLTDSDVQETPRLRGTSERKINEVRWSYDEDIATGDLAESYVFRRTAPTRSVLAIESSGVRSVSGSIEFLKGRSRAPVGRFGATAPVIDAVLLMRSGELLEVGDAVKCTFRNLQNPFAVNAAVINSPFQVVEHEIDFRRKNVRVTLLGFPDIVESLDRTFVRAHSITGTGLQTVA